MNITSFGKSKWFKRVIVAIGAVLLILVGFKAGEMVGFRKARFSYQVGERYFRSFAGPAQGFPGDFGGRDFLMGHGLSGKILSVGTSTLILQEPDGEVRTVSFGAETQIRRFRDAVPAAELTNGIDVIIVGAPTETGIVEARLIRIAPLPPEPMRR